MVVFRCLPPDRTWHKVNDYSGDLREGRWSTSRGSNPAGLCCSLTHSVQCGSTEPSSFTNPESGSLARMPGYSLNLRARSSAIHRGQRCQCCSSPTRAGPGLESATDFGTPSGTNIYIYIYIYIYISFLPTGAGFDTRSIFKRSLTGLNSEFSFS